MKTNEDYLKEIDSFFASGNGDSAMESLIVDAIETGIRYWCNFWPDTKSLKGTSKFYSVNVWETIKKGDTLEFGEDEFDGQRGTINLRKIVKALNKIMKFHPRVYVDIREENYDCEIADYFFQMCLFGEVIFG